MSNTRLQSVILFIGVIVCLIKFWAFYITNSNSIFSDALESIVNIVVGVFSLYSLYLSSLPQDDNHPYGHGKVEFIASTIEGTLIFISGIIILIKSIQGFYHPTVIESLDYGLILVTICGTVNYILGMSAATQGKKNQSPALVASGEHLKSDGYTSIGLIIGLLILKVSGILWIDNFIAILFCIIILYQGVKILRVSIAGIMDESDHSLIEGIVETINRRRVNSWIDIHNFRIIKYGSKIHIDAHFTLPWYFNGREIHHEVKQLEKAINEHNINKLEMFVHTDPCEDHSCKICLLSECKVRKNKFEEKIEWNISNLIRDAKHSF